VLSRIEVPTGVSTFKDPNAPPRHLIEPWCDLRHYATFDKGGHFPALENPEAVISEIRSFARTLR
jgi:microsomal epoxide hydrolase